MARRDPDKPGLVALDAHKEAFESGHMTASEIADTLGVSRQKTNAAIKRAGWCRPAARSAPGAAAKGGTTKFTTAEAGDLLVSFGVATLARAHSLVTGGDLGPSALKAVSAAAAAAEGILQRRGIILPVWNEDHLQRLEIAVLSGDEEAAIRTEVEAAMIDVENGGA